MKSAGPADAPLVVCAVQDGKAFELRARAVIDATDIWGTPNPAAFGVVPLLIPATQFGLASMGIAVLIHEGATVWVVLNAVRLLRFVEAADERAVQPEEGTLTHRPQEA